MGIQNTRQNDVPRINSCIPTYNRSDLLKKMLTSVLRQTVKPYEVVDNCSDDNTEAVARRFPVVTYYRNERNLGFVGNWNKCIEVAKGDFLTILHSDDLILPHWVEEWRSVLKQYQASNVGAFFSDLFTKLINRGLYGMIVNGFFIDIGLPEDYLSLSKNPNRLLSVI